MMTVPGLLLSLSVFVAAQQPGRHQFRPWQDETPHQQDEFRLRQDEPGPQRDETLLRQDEPGLRQDEFRLRQDEPGPRQDEPRLRQMSPPLIPMPQSVAWTAESFSFDRCEAIVINDPRLRKEAAMWLKMTGADVPVRHRETASGRPGVPAGKSGGPAGKPVFQLNIAEVKTPLGKDEAYHLAVSGEGVVLTANTPHGIFNGLQTLYQLKAADNRVPGCSITDYPAYRWRGYMVDAGRNYHSVDQLKRQIDIMARYKLNVFRFHLTENVAWRLQIKKYPQLTSAASMTRNKGRYYSVGEMKDLIRYCRDRHITLVPEIDMPGHSAAFTRAMGTDMQSDKGLRIVLEVLEEVCTTYDVPYIHIGADEVEIRNQDFLPEVIKLIRSHDKEVIAWAPGGNYDDRTIRQLWKDEAEEELKKPSVRYIDSRYLYLSDMDPQTTVATIFQRQLGGKTRGDGNLLGAEICLWDDRKIAQESDHLTMNAVFPAIVTFGERSWRGGGYPGINYYIGPDTSARAAGFAAFEDRLIAHKKKYFTGLPFPYVRQSHIRWKLFGPFRNEGNLDAAFWPEAKDASPADSAAAIHATGATVWLWQSYAPQTKAWIPDPEINTTWYAFGRFWSDSDTTVSLWAEFKNLSRSGADATPPKGEWDYKRSRLWLNGALIPPPEWKHPGRPSGLLEEPMVDEGYYYRPPPTVRVKKGWNQFLVKLPLGAFDFSDWQRPPKWMFTVVPVRKGPGINWEAAGFRFSE